MKFLANENFPHASYLYLKELNFDISSIGVDNPSIQDNEVIQIAIDENRTILTFDRDYGELIFRYGMKPAAGVIYFRITHFDPEYPGKFLLDLLQDKNLKVEGFFTVVTSNNIRQRTI